MGNVTGSEARKLLSMVNAEMFSCQKIFTIVSAEIFSCEKISALSGDIQKECTKSWCREIYFEELKKLRNKLTYIICQSKEKGEVEE